MAYVYIFGIGCFLLFLMLLYLVKIHKSDHSQGTSDDGSGYADGARGTGSQGAKSVRCLRCNRALKIQCLQYSNIERCPWCGFQFVVVLWDSHNNLYMSGLEDQSQEYGSRHGSAEKLPRYLKLLGINGKASIENVSIEEIRKHYYKTIQQYHPDKYASLPPEFRELAEKKTKELNEAYAGLMRHKTS